MTPVPRKYTVTPSHLTKPWRRRSGRDLTPGVRFLVAHDTGKPAPPPAVVAAEQPGTAVTTVRLNIRRGRPNTRAPVVQVVPAGTTLAYRGWTDAGEAVNGNPRRYEDRDAPFFRAGGVG